jgi:hypothetical protein
VALVAFGGGEAPTVAAVLLYRLISFWVPLPIGGTCYLGLLRARRKAQRQSALEAPPRNGLGGQPETTEAVAEGD